jgi:hypothetical protein
MTTAERIVEALEEMHEAAKENASAYAEAQDIWYAKGIQAALSKAQSIAEGF